MAQASTNGTCKKVGQTTTSGSINYICVKSGSRLTWQVIPAKTLPTQSPPAEVTGDAKACQLYRDTVALISPMIPGAAKNAAVVKGLLDAFHFASGGSNLQRLLGLMLNAAGSFKPYEQYEMELYHICS